jgi:hypothetical protein
MNVKEQVTIYESAARTATPATSTLTLGSKAGVFVIDATTAGSPSVVFTILGVDPLSGKTWTILASAAITSTGTTILRVDPGLTASANLIAKDVLPQGVNVTAVHGNGVSITYTMSFLGVE